LKREFKVFHFFIIPASIGAIGGFSAYIFRKLIAISGTLFSLIPSGDLLYPFIIPLVFLLTYAVGKGLLVSPENVTVDEIAKRISLEKGGFNLKKGIVVLALTSFNIGFGVPVGREGPIAKLGGVLSELFSTVARVDKVHAPIYLTCGVSSAISATFNAPVAAILFGLEIVLGKMNSYILIPLVVSCGIAAMISQQIFGDFAAFAVPKLSYTDSELPFVLLLSALLAAMSTVFTLLLEVSEKWRLRLRKQWGKILLISGFSVGAILLACPYVAGVGYENVTGLFRGAFSPPEALKVAVLKFLAVSLSFGSGVFGGFMSPSIFIGAFAGYAFGGLLGLDPNFFALTGTASFLSGISGAPFRSSLIIVELTHNYQAIVPILFSSILTGYFIGILKRVSFVRRTLYHKGIDPERLVERMGETFKVSRFTVIVPPVYENSHIGHIFESLREFNYRYIPVLKSAHNRRLTGIVSLRDLRLSAFGEGRELRVKDIMTFGPFVITESSSLDEVLDAIALLDTNLIPVVDEDGIYVGMFSVDAFLREITFRA